MPLIFRIWGWGLGWGCGIKKLRNGRFDPFLSISFTYSKPGFALAQLIPGPWDWQTSEHLSTNYLENR